MKSLNEDKLFLNEKERKRKYFIWDFVCKLSKIVSIFTFITILPIQKYLFVSRGV
jgi:hypothetical protein